MNHRTAGIALTAALAIAFVADGAGAQSSAPNMLLCYCCYDPHGPRDWTPEQLKYAVGYYLDRGESTERPTDTFFDTVLWMYRTSSRGRLFETAGGAKPTAKADWQEYLDRVFASGLQLNALEASAASLEKTMSRPVRLRVILTLPYPDVRVEDFGEGKDPSLDFRRSDDSRFQAIQWFVQAALDRWKAAKLPHLELLGFYWFNEGHFNLRKKDDAGEAALLTDLPLMRRTVRYVHSIRADGRPLTMTWIPYSSYGLKNLGVVADLLKAEPAERFDYVMIQPNYFFPRHKKAKDDLVAVVRNAASIGAGVELEFDESVVTDEPARRRLLDYLTVAPKEHARWKDVPAGYYQGVRAVQELATRPPLAPYYDALYETVRARRR